MFATRGYDASAVSAVAAHADLAPSAVYHYFGSKAELYESVFDVTADAIWSDLGAAANSHTTLRANIVQMVDDARTLSDSRPHHSDFLALVPMEARLHPEFAHLLDRRSKYQDNMFGSLAQLGIVSGELTGFDETEATEILRSLVMGWFFERHFAGRERPGSGEALIALLDQLADNPQ